MNSDTWEFENNICRCCHAEGFFFNLAEPRPFCGEMEVYADMMKDVFNIEVRPMPGALCELTYTICTSCVFKLREAIQFKKQVQSCEDRFLNLFFKNKLKVMKKAEIAKVKEEPDIDFKEEYLELDIDFDSNNDAELDDDANEDSKNHNLKSLLTATPTPIKKEKGKQKATPEKKAAPAKTRKQVGKKKVLVKKKDSLLEDPTFTLTQNELGKLYTCKLCQRVFKNRSLFGQHYTQVHLKKRPSVRACHLCDVKVPAYLRPFHMEKAHGQPAPSCNVCGKKFGFPNQVLRHQRIYHMGLLDFECQWCARKFPTNYDLGRHAIIHKDERPYECDFCTRQFKTKKYLSTHIAIHMNYKKYVCKVCAEGFVQSTSLKYHMAKKHPWSF